MSNAPSTAATSRKPAIGRIVLCLALCGVGAAVLFSTYYGRYRAARRTASAPGTLDSQYVERTRGIDETHYDVTYRYTVDGQTFTGADTITESPVITSVTILYDPADPSSSQTSKHEQTSGASLVVMTVLFGAIGLGGLVGALMVLYSTIRSTA